MLPSDKSRRLEIHAQLRALGLEGLLRLSNPFEVRQIILDALERTPSSTRAKTEEQALAGPLLTDEANFCSHCGDRVERPLQDGCSSSPCPVLRPVSAIGRSDLETALDIGLAALGYFNTGQDDHHWNEQEKVLREIETRMRRADDTGAKNG